MKPKGTQITMVLAALIGPAGAAGWTETPWLAIALMAISMVPILAFDASYRRWRPWAVDAIGGQEPTTTTITAKGLFGELAVWAGIWAGAAGWELVAVRAIWALVHLAEIGKFSRETDDHHHHHERHRATDQIRQ